MAGSRIVLTLLLVGVTGLVTGCGRRSDLDTPYQAQVQARRDAQRAGQPVPPEPARPANDKPFVLDKLL